MKKQHNKDTNAIVNLSASTDQDQLNRRLLLGTSLTGVAAVVWHKPLINAIVLPAHAQTSVMPKSFFGAGAGMQAPKSLGKSVVDALLPPATHVT
jgi:hypothetical protein